MCFSYLTVHLRVLVDICIHNLNHRRTITTAKKKHTVNTLVRRLMAKKKKIESVLQSGLCSQLRLEYHHQDGRAHSNSNSIRQAEKERGQERHNPHTLEERERRNEIKIWKKKKKDSAILLARLSAHAVQFALFPQVIRVGELQERVLQVHRDQGSEHRLGRNQD